jgi:uncharacterized protein DUF5317
MFILYALVIGIAAGLLMGGRLDRLGQLQVRWPWVAVAGLVVQVVLFLPGIGERLGPAAPAVYVASTLAVFLFVARNARLAGFPLIALGAASNLLAIVANGGYMPASPDALRAIGERAARGYSNSRELANPALAPLTDIFALPPWMPFANVFSIGDVLIALGVALAIALAMREPGAPGWRLPAPLRPGNPTK